MDSDRTTPATFRLRALTLLGAALIAAAVWAASGAGEATGQEVARWQHLALTHQIVPTASAGGNAAGAREGELARKIVHLGEEGWELVTVENFSREGTTTKTVFYFKRPR